MTGFELKSMATEENESYRFAFFCGICGESYATGPISAANINEAYDCAQREAQRRFNLCHRCERWVCDAHYNEDVMMCTGCAPRDQRKEERE